MRKLLQLFKDVTIIVDSREQAPYQFSCPVEVGTLPTGDYSLKGFEDRVAIERKALDDLIGSLTSGRKRFERELQRSRAYDYFAIVIEASLSDLNNGSYRSRMTPTSAVQSILALSVRYRVPVWFAENRQSGQKITESLLMKYARDICTRFERLGKAVVAGDAEKWLAEEAKERQGARTDLKPNIVEQMPQSRARDQAGAGQAENT